MSEAPGPRIVVLDDDPTGTQTVADLPIVLTPDIQTLSTAVSQWAGPLWVLTNTRAMKLADAKSHLAMIADRVQTVLGPSVRLVLRGDSTLRGHVLGEIDTLSAPDSVALFVPAFVEQGRVTIRGVHYVTLGDRRVEVATTEYARDPEFSYRTSDLVQWIAERDPGRPAFGMPLETLRSIGSSALADLLMSVPAHSVVVPDVETTADLQVIRDAWVEAQRRGRPVVLRCASSLAGVVTGAPAKPIAVEPVTGPVLVVCASYTSGATGQLAALAGLEGIASHQVDLSRAVSAHPDATNYCHSLAHEVADSLRAGRVTVLSTPRDTAPHRLNFAVGEQIMDAVVGTVRQLQGKFAALVTKGGITSARVARDALSVPIAYVRGQVLPGIPVWALDFPPGGAIDQVVIPGNVGQPTAIREIVSQFTGQLP
jgi:uncharacterized protein YgbK (DUF1537 family)